VVTSGLNVCDIYFRYKTTSCNTNLSTVELLDLENIVIAVWICYYVPWNFRYDVSHKWQQTACILPVFAPPYWILVRGVPPISMTFCSPGILMKSHESALFDLWRFQSSEDEPATCSTEIRACLGAARSALQSLTTMWEDRTLSKEIKLKLLKTLVWPVVMYGEESWTLKASDISQVGSLRDDMLQT